MNPHKSKSKAPARAGSAPAGQRIVQPGEDALGLWGSYFIAKFFLSLCGHLRMGFVWNLLFLVFLVLPMPAKLKKSRGARAARSALHVALAIGLMWGESWLPPVSYVIDFFSKYDLPTLGYAANFLGDFFFHWETLAAAAVVMGYAALRKWCNMVPVVLVALLFIGVRNKSNAPQGTLDAVLSNFYAAESGRSVRFEGGKLGAEVPNFDIVLVHVCSLAWDDLNAAGIENNPLLAGFDFVFRRYNSVTSHSTPSALRLYRANCGQPRHSDLYKDGPEECYLFENLRALGYDTRMAFNHDGKYGDMADFLVRYGKAGERLQTTDLAPYQINFDGRSIFDNYAILKRWWDGRLESGLPRAALYLNVVTLHGGAHRADDKSWWKRERVDHYREFYGKLSEDLERFYELVAGSGRRAVVLFVPEHGLGLRGSSIQANDLREIPLPYVTMVPAGIKLIAPGRRARPPGSGPASPVEVEKAVSHLGLAHLLGEFFTRDAFAASPGELTAMAAAMPETPYVAENQSARVIESGSEYYLFDKEGQWRRLPQDVRVLRAGTSP